MRTAIAAALDGLTVEGVTPEAGLVGLEFTPRTMTAFQCWPEWVRTAWQTRCVSGISWHVIILVPAGDVAAWVPVADALVGPVRDALEASVGHVTAVEPVTVAAGDPGTSMPGLRVYLDTPDS